MRETLWGFDPIYLGWLGAVLILALIDQWRGKK